SGDCLDAAHRLGRCRVRLKSSTLVAAPAAWDRPIMTLYTRRQLVVLLILLTIAGIGLAVGHWRRVRPDVMDQLEQLDRTPASPANSTTPRAEDARSPRSRGRPSTGGSAILRSAAAGASPSSIDLNRATMVELTRLPGVGPTLARRIVD